MNKITIIFLIFIATFSHSASSNNKEACTNDEDEWIYRCEIINDVTEELQGFLYSEGVREALKFIYSQLKNSNNKNVIKVYNKLNKELVKKIPYLDSALKASVKKLPDKNPYKFGMPSAQDIALIFTKFIVLKIVADEVGGEDTVQYIWASWSIEQAFIALDAAKAKHLWVFSALVGEITLTAQQLYKAYELSKVYIDVSEQKKLSMFSYYIAESRYYAKSVYEEEINNINNKNYNEVENKKLLTHKIKLGFIIKEISKLPNEYNVRNAIVSYSPMFTQVKRALIIYIDNKNTNSVLGGGQYSPDRMQDYLKVQYNAINKSLIAYEKNKNITDIEKKKILNYFCFFQDTMFTEEELFILKSFSENFRTCTVLPSPG